MRPRFVFGLVALFALSLPAQDPAQLVEAAQAAGEAGRWEEAAANYRKLTEAQPEQGQHWHMLGYSLHAAGKLDEALAVHLKATGFPAVAGAAAYNVACVHSLKGDKDKAFEWLGKSMALGFADPDQLAGDTDLKDLHADARWAELTKAVAAKAKQATTLFVATTPRQSARMAFFTRQGSPGQLALDWGKVAWQAKYDRAIDSPEFVGRKWRFGSDAWTSLDTSMPVVFGDRTVAPGHYYLTLEHAADGAFVLGVHDAAAVKKLQIDAFQAHKLTGGIAIPLQHTKVDEVADELTVRFDVAPGRHEGTLVVHFGGHRFTTPFAVAPLQ